MQKNYNPNTRHCIYGLDADLIILSLVSHELHFTLLREEIIFAYHEQESINKRTKRKLTKRDEFQLLHIEILRNYLYIEFSNISSLLSFTFNFERIIDDFVFISMFVGNDFIPHLPTVNISRGGMEQLFVIYKQVLPILDGYIIDINGNINVRRFKILCKRLSENEIESFILQYQFLKQYHEKVNKKKYSLFALTNIEKQQQLKQLNIQELETEISLLRDTTNETTKQIFVDRYYSTRWGKNYNKKQICFDYIKSLQWVLNYYYQGCCSWSYYYPHHYAPLISDMQLLLDCEPEIYKFELSTPYKPFQQLLAVLPIASSHILPKKYQKLMIDSNSQISKYYPKQFIVDMNLSISPWEGIALLPFINENELKHAINTLPIEKQEEEEHQYINSHKDAIIFKYDYDKSLKKNRIKGPVGFGPIADNVICLKYKLPSLDHCNNKCIANICNNSKIIIPGSPNLAAIPFNTQIKKIPVKTFGMSSNYETLVLQIIDADLKNKKDSTQYYDNLAIQYLNKFLLSPLYVGWPYFRQAQISEINTVNYTHSVVHLIDNKTHTMTNQLTQQQKTKFKKILQLQSVIMKVRGQLIEKQSAVHHVVLLSMHFLCIIRIINYIMIMHHINICVIIHIHIHKIKNIKIKQYTPHTSTYPCKNGKIYGIFSGFK
eukprot:326830_1